MCSVSGEATRSAVWIAFATAWLIFGTGVPCKAAEAAAAGRWVPWQCGRQGRFVTCLCRDKQGNLWLRGRVDDVVNVSGHRIGTMEVESALVEHPAVAEAAVIGRAHDVKGQALSAFVIVRGGVKDTDALKQELRDFVGKKIGAIAKPDDVAIAADLPKTRSGKIMRRLLQAIAEGRPLGDTTTLADASIVQGIVDQFKKK